MHMRLEYMQWIEVVSKSGCPYQVQYGTGPSCQNSSEAASSHHLSSPLGKTAHSFPKKKGSRSVIRFWRVMDASFIFKFYFESSQVDKPDVKVHITLLLIQIKPITPSSGPEHFQRGCILFACLSLFVWVLFFVAFPLVMFSVLYVFCP